MNCQRATVVLQSLADARPAFTADEIEELLAGGFALEADPYDLQTLQWLSPIVAEHGATVPADPLAAANLMTKLGDIDGKLKRDWYRFTTSDTKIAAQEQARREIRRALGVLQDEVAREQLVATIVTMRRVPQGMQLAPCVELGDELYAITAGGLDLLRQLTVRLDRLATIPLKTFLRQLAKTGAKMAAFTGEIRTLAGNIGFVKKNPHQVVIGLAKSGMPATQAIDTYREAMRTSAMPDVAVTSTRNVGAFGSPMATQQRLRQAVSALQRVGFQRTPVMEGAAKTLLPFEPLATGAQRFRQLYDLGRRNVAQGDLLFKITGRLMPCQGTPEVLIARTVAAMKLLRTYPSEVDRRGTSNLHAAALAGMVKSDEQLPELVQRFRQIETLLVKSRVSVNSFADDDALECVACAGTPAEVVDTVQTLLAQLTAGRQATRGDVVIAASFAKRFAF